MEEQFKYRTIAEPVTGEFRDRGSKFLAFIYPITSKQDVKRILSDLKNEHPKAVHYCYAYRIGTEGTDYRANDDGEPAGSAGRPILGQIDSTTLINVLAVVVRYFGGTLLGIPGLINAYKTATTQALQKAVIVEKWVEEIVDIAFDYAVMGEVLYLLRQSDASIYHQDLQLFCNIKAGIPKKHATLYLQKLSELRGVKIEKNVTGQA